MKAVLVGLLTVVTSSPAFADGTISAAGGPGDAKAVSQVIHIEADDIKFVPKEVTTQVGQTVNFVITNHGAIVHEFVIGDKTEQAEHEKEMQAMGAMEHQEPNAVTVKPGETRTLIWKFRSAGTTEYACHVPGHFAAGMVGVVRVKAQP